MWRRLRLLRPSGQWLVVSCQFSVVSGFVELSVYPFCALRGSEDLSLIPLAIIYILCSIND